MAGTLQKRAIMRKIRDRKINFLEKKGSSGGDKSEFITEVLREKDEIMKDVEKEAAIDEVMAYCASSVWDNKTKRNDDQMVIAGFELDQEIRFRDPTAPSGFRTVLSRFATFRHHLQSIELLEDERNDIDEKIKEQKALNAHGLRLAGGNVDALMIRFTDFKAAAA